MTTIRTDDSEKNTLYFSELLLSDSIAAGRGFSPLLRVKRVYGEQVGWVAQDKQKRPERKPPGRFLPFAKLVLG